MKLSRNEIKVSFEKPRFYVDEANKTVKCKLFFTVKCPYDYDMDITFPTSPRTCSSAKAVCAPGDKFDLLKGKKIALSKAENKAYNMAVASLRKKAQIVMTTANLMAEFFDKADDCIRHNERYIKTFE